MTACPGRILTATLAALVASGFTYLIYYANRGIVPAVLQWVLIAGIGLAAGFSTRYLLAGRTYTLQLLTVFLSLLIGLIFSRAHLARPAWHPPAKSKPERPEPKLAQPVSAR
ncbi:MAG: hypothetical protein M5U05_04415 [Anaerolineales bacterium]|nr:hypothetical protein [Anaerolineales bacterium]